MDWNLWIVAPIIGFIGMLSGGYWGVGSGWIVVPAMLILGFSPFEAVGIGLLQMVPATISSVIKQCPEITWGKNSPGRGIALPLGLGAIITSLLGKSINTVLFNKFGSTPLSIMLIGLILFIMIQTLCSKTRCYNDQMVPITPKMSRAAFGVGLATGLVSSLLGVGGGILIRPLLSTGFKMPEYFTSRIVRLLVLVTTVCGGITYLINSGNFQWNIFIVSMITSAGGMVGFPLGIKLHKIVYDTGYAQHIHKSFGIIAFALLLNTICKICNFQTASRYSMLGIGSGLMIYLISFALYSRKHPKIK